MIARAGLPACGLHALGYGPLIGLHPRMRQLYEEIERVASAPIPVVVSGPTGAGKELVVRALHARSERPGPLMALNVHSVTESLAESTLFGVARGAFTGATVSRRGLISAAHKGTLLLDEASELSHSLQAKLLRVIESSRVRRVGAEDEVPVNVRVMLCTQEPPWMLAGRGLWRSDFRYRVSGWVITVPPVAERCSDLPLIARHILADRSDEVEWAKVDSELQRYAWPGNVREVQRVLLAADLLAGAGSLGSEHVRAARARLGSDTSGQADGKVSRWQRSIDQVVREHVEAVLEKTGFDTAAASSILGIARSTLYRRLDEWGLGSTGRGFPIPESGMQNGNPGRVSSPAGEQRQ